MTSPPLHTREWGRRTASLERIQAARVCREFPKWEIFKVTETNRQHITSRDDARFSATGRRTVQPAYNASIQSRLGRGGGEKRRVIRSPRFPSRGGITWGYGWTGGGADSVPPPRIGPGLRQAARICSKKRAQEGRPGIGLVAWFHHQWRKSLRVFPLLLHPYCGLQIKGCNRRLAVFRRGWLQRRHVTASCRQRR